jgi:hypothetical protein
MGLDGVHCTEWCARTCEPRPTATVLAELRPSPPSGARACPPCPCPTRLRRTRRRRYGEPPDAAQA